MRKDQARRAILREWDVWAGRNLPADRVATSSDGFAFYWYLRSEHPDLLSFKAASWDVVHDWLRHRGKVH